MDNTIPTAEAIVGGMSRPEGLGAANMNVDEAVGLGVHLGWMGKKGKDALCSD